MSFSAEIKDFVTGFQAGARVGGDIQDRRMQREKWEFDKAFKEDAAGRAERALDLREKGLGLRSADREERRRERETRAAARAAEKEERAAAAAAEKEEKTRARRANELLPEEPKASRSKPKEPEYEDEYDFEDGFGDTGYGDEYEESALPVYEVDEEEVTTAFAEDGGLMEDEKTDREEDEPPLGFQPKTDLEPTAAIPTEAPKAEAPPAAAEEPEVNRSGKSDPLFREAADVTRDVMDKWNEELKEQPEAVSTEPKKDQARIASAEPASPDAIKAVDAKIDPNNEMEPYRKGAVRLVEAYKFFVEKGDIEKARKIAGEIIKFNQQASMTLGQLALAAIERGDLQSASKLVADAYDQVPDGGKIEAQPTPKGTIAYKIDKEGTARQQGEIGARELWGLASKVADGSAFLERMTALAAEGTPGAAPAGKTSGETKTGGKRGSYKADVATAAKARKIYDTLNGRYETAVKDFGADSEEAAALKQQVSDAASAYNTAWEKAQRAAEKTKRPTSVLDKDFKLQLGKVVVDPTEIEPAIPEAPAAEGEAPEESSALGGYLNWLEAGTPQGMGRRVGNAVGNAIMGSGEEALPTQPAPAAAAPAPAPAPAVTGGRPIPPETMLKAKEAIAKGAPREAVIQRLRENGFDTGGL